MSQDNLQTYHKTVKIVLKTAQTIKENCFYYITNLDCLPNMVTDIQKLAVFMKFTESFEGSKEKGSQFDSLKKKIYMVAHILH